MTKSMMLDGWVHGWMDGWMGGLVGSAERVPAWQDLGLMGSMIGYSIGITAVVEVEDAQGW